MKNLIDIINEKLILSKIVYKYKHPEDEYFYHEALEDRYRTWFIAGENVLQYSIDNCNTWHELNQKIETPEINKGERVYFKGENMKTGKNHGIVRFVSNNKKFNAGGNIMSLIYGDNFEDQSELIENRQFESLFYNNRKLISAKDLVLPATKLTEQCYRSMFEGCTSLTDAPKLPATELAKECYARMFFYCEALMESPELLATELATKCYIYMFFYCISLNKITMLATDVLSSARYCLYEWVIGISKRGVTGVFIKAKGVDIPEGVNGIPKDWTVKEI